MNVATSTDLVNWEPMLDENGEFLKVMTPRAGKFDSDLTECGPPAILTDKGILLLYNGKNKSGAEGDTLYTANSYCAGQALFDAKDPTKLIDRLDKPFYIPESDFEKSGQYPAGTVFIEGLVFHNQKWFLYFLNRKQNLHRMQILCKSPDLHGVQDVKQINGRRNDCCSRT